MHAANLSAIGEVKMYDPDKRGLGGDYLHTRALNTLFQKTHASCQVGSTICNLFDSLIYVSQMSTI